MDSRDFMKRMQELADKNHDRTLDQHFQQQLQAREQLFQAQQTDRFIEAYQATNKRLEDINTSLRDQLEQTKLEAKTAKRDAKWATAFSVISILVAIASVLVTALT